LWRSTEAAYKKTDVLTLQIHFLPPPAALCKEGEQAGSVPCHRGSGPSLGAKRPRRYGAAYPFKKKKKGKEARTPLRRPAGLRKTPCPSHAVATAAT
jgi:hypothetical protein